MKVKIGCLVCGREFRDTEIFMHPEEEGVVVINVPACDHEGPLPSEEARELYNL